MAFQDALEGVADGVELGRGQAEPPPAPALSIPGVVLPLRYRDAGRELSFLSITAVVGTPMDVTVSELAIESFYPADARTAAALGGA